MQPHEPTGAESGPSAPTTPADVQQRQLGTSRPPLAVKDLPDPEAVFQQPRIGPVQVARYVLGPSLIALGAAVGSGEWLLGPLAAANSGFTGTFFIILIAATLQAGFNYECVRYIIATGEPSLAGFMRTPPGWMLWLPLSLGLLWFAHIFGGWALAAGESLFAAFAQRAPDEGGDQTVAWLCAIGLSALCMVSILASRRVTRMIERVSLAMVVFILLFLLVLDVVMVGPEIWLDALAGFVTPALPAGEVSATALGALAGYAGATAGLNWFFLGHYRDKGYGMGFYTGYLGGLRADRTAVASAGATFPDTPDNARRWRRWRGYLRLEMLGIFLPFALLGMLLPSILMVEFVDRTGVEVTQANAATYLSVQGSDLLNPFLGRVLGLVGVFVFLSTLLVIVEGLARSVVDGVSASPPGRLSTTVSRDPRRLYVPMLVAVLVLIAVFTNLTVPTTLIQISANIATLGSVVFPPVLFYLNRRLPKPARIGVAGTLVLAVNVVFFGTFFTNFVVQQATGSPLFTL